MSDVIWRLAPPASSARKKIKDLERQKAPFRSFPIFLGPHDVGHADEDMRPWRP